MAKRRAVIRARDDAGNVVGGTGYEVRIYSNYNAATLASVTQDSAGLDARANPANPNAGWQTTLTVQMLAADTSITVASTTGVLAGDMFPVVDGAFAVMLVVKTVTDATHLALEAAPGGAHTYPIGSTVGDPQQLGHWQGYVDDTQDYDWTVKNIATGKESSPLPMYALAPSAAPTMPNQILNSDFGRRTVFALAMPEVYADATAWTGGAPAVAANALTVATASTHCKWTGPTSMWRDGRWSAQFKMTATAGSFRIAKYIDANDAYTTGNAVIADYSNGNFRLIKLIAGAVTTVATVAQAGTLNNRFWLEHECQGTTYIAKMYNSGAAAAAKASATVLQTLSGTISDAGVVSGGVALWSDQANSVWGEMAASPGGVYVETWLPESFAYTFAGTLGGQAIGYDESADSGPNVAGAPYKQWSLRYYQPASTRGLRLEQDLPDGSIAASTAYTGSAYMKVSGLGGTGTLCEVDIRDTNSALGATHDIAILIDGGATAWTRKTGTAVTASTSRRAYVQINLGGSLVGGTATGSAFLMLPQLEQGSAVTAWHNAAADDAELVYTISNSAGAVSVNSATWVEVSANTHLGDTTSAEINLPWDATVVVTGSYPTQNQNVGFGDAGFSMDGATYSGSHTYFTTAAQALQATFARRLSLPAGRHRVAMLAQFVGATGYVGASNFVTSLIVSASRGK